MKRDAMLWAGLLIGPIVWLASFLTNFALAPWTCIWRWKLSLYLVSAAALIITTGAGLLAFRQWDRLGRVWPDEGEGAIPRARTMALGGVVLSVLSFLVILAQAIVEVMLGACE